MIIENLQEFYRLLSLNAPLISIDYGSKKIGIAVSNQERNLAMPLSSISEINKKVRANILLDVIKKYNACGIVIGFPVNMNGETGEQGAIIIKFAEELTSFTSLPIYLQDERLTTKAANSLLKSFSMKRKERNNNDDAIAASMILETTLNSIKNIIN